MPVNRAADGDHSVPRGRHSRRAHLPVAIVLACGIALSLSAYGVIQRWESRLARQRFDWAAREVLFDVRTDIAYALDSLDAIAAFIRSSQAIEPSEFHDFTIRLLKRRGVAALGIAEPRGSSYRVVQLEPQAQSPGVLGSDLASGAQVRAELGSAQPGAVTLFPNPRLARDLDPGDSYLAVMPARSSGSDRPAYSGPDPQQIVVGILDMTELLAGPRSAGDPPLGADMHPGSPAIRLALHSHPNGASPPAGDDLRHAMELSIGGLEFALVASSPIAPWSAGFWWIRWAALFIGLATTLLVAAYLRATGARNRLLQEQKEKSDQRFHGAFEVANHGMALVNPEGRWLRVNPALCAMLGYSAQELEALDFQSVTHAEDLPADLSAFDRLLQGEIRSYRAEKRYLHKNGHAVWIDLSVAPVFNPDGSVAHFVCQVIDLTRRREAEAQLVHAQKMESIGHLTGGIAHDFNNLLTVVLGNLELAERRVREDERLTALLGTAREAAERGATLTKHLLAVARRQTLDPKTVVLSAALAELERLIRRTIGEAVTLEIATAPDLWPIRVDPVQLESAVLNLVVNARDAIEGDGTISIHARNEPVDASHAEMEKIEPGDYVLLSVTDDGSGIPPENLSKVIEPFFTTKEVGKGSGLGLSMVHGFVKQSKGHVTLYSELGLGTTVKLYLPRAVGGGRVERTIVTRNAIPMAREGERILVVEDQADVRELAATFLEELGYVVLEAESGKSALRLLEQDGSIDLVLSDVVMPGDLDGFELARAVADRFPAIPVVLASGYPRHSSDDGSVKEEILLKPYSLRSLGDRVRRVLDGRDTGSSAQGM